MAQTLYPGCDVWLNNPLRPLEACGTSGMKSALNGGLNLSILDGWWDEWFDGENGWAIPTADGVEDPDRRDDLEAAALYDLIERRWRRASTTATGTGCPPAGWRWCVTPWRTLGPKVLATRMVQDYVEQLYVPAADERPARWTAAPSPAPASWRRGSRRVRRRLVRRARRPRRVRGRGGHPGGRRRASTCRAFVSLGELVAGGRGRAGRARARSTRTTSSPSTAAGWPWRRGATRVAGTCSPATCCCAAPAPFGYTVRVLPQHDAQASATETALVTNA